jgi:hypothetical protein
MQNLSGDLAELKELATAIQDHEWVSIPSSETTPTDKAKSQGATEILAQCCKPGACGPKTIDE